MLNNQIQIFQYNGSPVTFKKGDSVMINATEMAKPFGKNVSHWLRNKSTEEFINELAALRNRKGIDLVQVANGVGCFMHEDVALEFARWLSPAFSIWCNDRIKELLTTGSATINTYADTPEEIMARALQVANETLKRKEERLLLLQHQNELQEEQLKQQAPKVNYHDKVLTSVSTYTVTQIAKEFGFGAETLNRKLHEKGVQYKQNGQWLLYAKFQDKGYTKTITRQYTGASGVTHTSQHTVWTEAGRKFIHSLFV